MREPVETFERSMLKWAKAAFQQEVRTDFQYISLFDSFASKRLLTILRQRSPEELEVLARVLPLQVLRLTPEAERLREELSARERHAVERLRADYDKDHFDHWADYVQVISRMDTKAGKQEFNAACRNGNVIVNEIASQRGWVPATAARGEWGLVLEKDGLRITLSFKLARWMELDYGISIWDKKNVRCVRSRAQYLGDLGIGGCWNVPGAREFPEKMIDASNFAIWHWHQYEIILTHRTDE